MEITIFTFSGTGNTKYISKRLANTFEKKNIGNIISSNIEDFTKTSVQIRITSDLIGIGFPVHAFDAPDIVYKFIELLPEKKCKVFVFKTCGSKFINGGSFSGIRNKLAKKGYDVISESFFEMPSNYAVETPQDDIIEYFGKIRPKVEKLVDEIIQDKGELIYSGFFNNIFSMISAKMEKFGASFFGMALKAGAKCTDCGLCYNICPVNNIVKKNGKLIFKSKCLMCMRCIYSCPQNAIRQRLMPFTVLKNGYSIAKIASSITEYKE